MFFEILKIIFGLFLCAVDLIKTAVFTTALFIFAVMVLAIAACCEIIQKLYAKVIKRKPETKEHR